MSRLILACLLLLTLGGQAVAQSSQVGRVRDQKSLQMVRTETPPVIDGVLDDAVWQKATFIDDFHQIFPVDHAPPSERTEVYVLYDDNALYVGVKQFINPDEISRNILRRSSSIFPGDDYFTVSIDPFNTRRGGYYFGVNANGVRGDGLYRNISEFYNDWDSIWDVATKVVDDGWVIEYAIPFKSISFDPDTDTWGMNFSRKIQGRNEQMVWVSNDRRFDPSSAGLAVGITGLNQGLGLDVVPSVSLGRERRFNPGSADSSIEPSVDVFYKLTSNLNASVTLNTDFSATEVDDRQVNLTRFNLFFPEKRDFFLRDADIFEFGRLNQNGRPFFSRKIGLGGNGEAIDIALGGKVSGRIGDWEIGALSIRQDATDTLAADTLSVLRLKTGVLAESTIGAIFTEGDPTSNSNNSLAGVDFLYRTSGLAGGRILEVSGWLQHTKTENISGNDNAGGISIAMPSQEGLTGSVGFTRLEDNFKPALGFANRVGVDQLTAELYQTWRPQSKRWQTLDIGASLERFNDSNGDLQSENFSVTPLELTTRVGDSVFLRANFNKEVLVSPFPIYAGVVIPMGNYAFENHGIEFRTASFRKVTGRLSYITGTFYDGSQDKLFGSITWQPSPHVRTNFGFNITDVQLPQGNFTTRVLTAGFDYVFSSTLSLVNLVQYDNVSETAGINLRLHWVPEEGQELYFVINHNLQDLDRDNTFHTSYSAVTLKYSYTFRY